ncbi:MAG: EAL domain-containing protein [Nitriliruptoraceae bacterium]
MRSAIVFVVIGIVLHFLMARLVQEQFHEHAQFHAVFVTEAVVQPRLVDADLSGGATRTEQIRLAGDLRRYIVDLDDAVYHVVVWDLDGTMLAADETALLDAGGKADRSLLNQVLNAEPVSVAGPAPYLLGEPPVTSTLRTFVPLEVGRSLVVEIHQDWSPTLAASRTFSRTLDGGLFAGIVLLWIMSLPIARRAGRRLHERSRTDELTGLPNRTALEERLSHALARLEGTSSCVALLFIDLDGFKAINDTLGHAAGDAVLCQIAERLHGCTRAGDTVSRFAGDEFVIILENTDFVLAEQVARRILHELRMPLYDFGDVGLSASIGMAATRDAAIDPDVLLLDADAAMYHVKNNGGDGYRVFDDDLRDQVVRRNHIESQLRGAVARGEMHLVFQPFVPLGDPDHDLVAVEALARWTHPQLGPVGPDEFIPLAESNGAIEQLGDWVMLEACQHLADWQTGLTPDRPFVVYVNLSAVQLTDRLLDSVDRHLAETGADPHRLGFEITETAVLTSSDSAVIELLNQLRQRGCRIALDDFGTGYSSMSRLRAIPLDLLKIDGSFVNQHGTAGREQAILTAVSGLAREMDIQVLAEGIETQAQLDRVTNLGFDLAQGYHLARPAPPAAVDTWLTNGLSQTSTVSSVPSG